MSQLATKYIKDDAVTAAKLNADCAGAGLSPNGSTGAMDVNVDDSTLEISTDTLQVKGLGIDTAQLAATSVTAAKLGSDVAGDGLTGGNGSDLDVEADSTGGANLGTVVNVSSNGVAIKIDDDTIGENGSNQLYIKANSIGATEIDETDNYSWTGTNDFSSATSVSVPTPTQDGHAATKGYVDSAIEGRTPKGVANALSDSDETLSGIPTNIDGVTSWSDGDLVLLTNQTSGDENGIWAVHSGSWTRPDNFATGSSAAGATIWIDAGTTYQDQRWVCTSNVGSDVVDTDDLDWAFDGGLSNVTAGTGLQKSGNTIHVGDGTTGNVGGINRTADDISVAVDDSTLEISSNIVQIKDLGVTTGKLGATSVTAAKLGSDVAGNGLTGGNGSDLDVDPDTTGGANLGTVVNVSSNGVAIKIDDSTIGENGSNQLEVKDAGVTNAKLNSDVAGDGISGGAGSALALDINGIASAETSADDADLIAIYDDSATGLRKMTRANFLAGLGDGETSIGEAHTITSGETTAGYFTLSQSWAVASFVQVIPEDGIPQHNKQAVGATGITPDFDCLNNNQIHFNNNGAATGLSELLTTNDKVFIIYSY